MEIGFEQYDDANPKPFRLDPSFRARTEPPLVRGVKLREVSLVSDEWSRYFCFMYQGRKYWVERKHVQVAAFADHWMRIAEEEAYRLGLIPWVFPKNWNLNDGLWAEQYQEYEAAPSKAHWVLVTSFQRISQRSEVYLISVPGKRLRIPAHSVLDIREEVGHSWFAITDWAVWQFKLPSAGSFPVTSYRKKDQYRKRSRWKHVSAH